MLRRSILACAVLLAGSSLVSSAAFAKPVQLTVTEAVQINAPPAKVWALIQNFSDITWLPPVKSSTATNGNTVGSVRTLDLGGPKVMEQLTKYDASKMHYSYKFTDNPDNVKAVPVTDYRSTIEVKSQGGGRSQVVWRGYFLRADHADKPAEGQDDASAVKAIQGIYRGGLDKLKTTAEAP